MTPGAVSCTWAGERRQDLPLGLDAEDPEYSSLAVTLGSRATALAATGATVRGSEHEWGRLMGPRPCRADVRSSEAPAWA